jgi:hypothetical protein
LDAPRRGPSRRSTTLNVGMAYPSLGPRWGVQVSSRLTPWSSQQPAQRWSSQLNRALSATVFGRAA